MGRLAIEMSVVVVVSRARNWVKEGKSTERGARAGKRRIGDFIKWPLTGGGAKAWSRPPTYCRVEQPGSSSGS
jgi:hypothetical protein